MYFLLSIMDLYLRHDAFSQATRAHFLLVYIQDTKFWGEAKLIKILLITLLFPRTYSNKAKLFREAESS